MPRGRPRKIPKAPPAVPKGPPEPNLQRFDPWNSSSTGHQRAETRGPQGWRESRFKKMNYQFKSGNGGGDEFMSDTVGYGSKEYDEKLGVYIPKEARELATGQRKSVLDMLRNPSKRRKVEEDHKKREKTPPIPANPPAQEPPRRQEEDEDGLTAEEREIIARMEAEEQEALLLPYKRKPAPSREETEVEEGEGGLTEEEGAAIARLEQQELEERQTTQEPQYFTPPELEDDEPSPQPEEKPTGKPRFFASPKTAQTNKASSTATYHPPPTLPPPSEPPSRDSPAKSPPAPASPQKQRGIFDNLVIYINGSTYPAISDHKLKHLLATNGAQVALHLARKQVTHVILGKSSFAGGGLAAQKLQKETKTVRGRGVKFVNVDWVMESIKAGKRQPEGRFVESTVHQRQGGSAGGLFAKAAQKTSKSTQ
ncbi:hypothetical protein QBC40DRAFT_211123 [Triangularia verruculosa]|uniref:BRCT domain-containing protein n=1 Tax=Triangularia verruculosa TaxID=2587418 RepID=A0AAN7ARC3_9PEZI|nr:hypothetical protein QBC40DRAFT_211123 [Triangularia verruculosa]